MATTVHIPKLEQELSSRAEWSPGFFDLLRRLGARNAETIDEMAEAIRRNRSSKGPPRL